MSEERPETSMVGLMALWQKAMWEGFEMMLKASTFPITMGKALEDSTTLQERIQESVQAGMRAMNFPTTEHLHRIAEGHSAMQAQLEAMKGAVKLEEEWRQGVDETIQRLLASQEEGQKAFQAWTTQVEDRPQDFRRL